MKHVFLFILSLTVAAVSLAADTKPAEEAFMKYWSVYSKKDFAKAAAEMLPSDLEATKAAVLPVFLAGQGSKNKDAQEVLGAFFGKTVGKAREAMTAQEVFAGLNRVMAVANPDMFEAFKEANLTIVFVRNMAPDAVEVHFQVTVRGASDMDSEALVKKDGRWWIRLKDEPAQTAASFKELFSKSS